MAKSTVGALSPPPAPLLFSPCSDLNRGGTGEKRHMPSRPIRTHTKRKIKLLRHARMRTRRYDRILAHTSSNTRRDNNERVWKGGEEWIAWSCKERARFKSWPSYDQWRRNAVRPNPPLIFKKSNRGSGNDSGITISQECSTQIPKCVSASSEVVCTTQTLNVLPSLFF